MSTGTEQQAGCTEPGCKAPPEFLQADGRCWSHSNDPDVAKQREQARKLGGARTAAKTGKALSPDDLPPLDGPKAAAVWAETVGRAVALGVMSASRGQAVRSILAEWRQAFNAGEVQERLEELERMVKRNGRGATG